MFSIEYVFHAYNHLIKSEKNIKIRNFIHEDNNLFFLYAQKNCYTGTLVTNFEHETLSWSLNCHISDVLCIGISHILNRNRLRQVIRFGGKNLQLTPFVKRKMKE